jgi:hypothetical protein
MHEAVRLSDDGNAGPDEGGEAPLGGEGGIAIPKLAWAAGQKTTS